MLTSLAKPFSAGYSEYVGFVRERFLEFISTVRSSKALSLAVILVLAAAIPLTVFIAQKQQDIRQRAADTKLASSQGQPLLNSYFIGDTKVFTTERSDTKQDEIFFTNPQNDKKEKNSFLPSLKPTDEFVSKGYIIEFKEDSLTQYQTKIQKQQKEKTAIASIIQSYKNNLLSEHEKAKRDILSKLGKQDMSKIQDANGSIIVMGEYTTVFNGMALDITDSQAKQLEGSPFVKKIYPNLKVKTQLMDSVPLIHAPDVWNLQDSQQRNIKGTGVRIAIIDTGVDYRHSDLGGCLGSDCKVKEGYDFVTCDSFNWAGVCVRLRLEDTDPMDDQGHGTHVAGIAAGAVNPSASASASVLGGASPPYLGGVAPGATIIAYKVLNKDGEGLFSWIISGIERSVDPNQDGDLSDHVDVINMSLGADCLGYYGSFSEDCGPDDPPSRAVNNASDAGVAVVVAAGNSGPWAGTIGSPGTALNAITVGATDKSNNLARFSSRGPVIVNDNEIFTKPDIVAPGVNICAPEWDDWLSEKRCLDGKHISISGTSMATPHVAGLVALMKQAHPQWTPIQIKSVLKNTTYDVSGTLLDKGTGRIHARAVTQPDDPPYAQLYSLFSSSGSLYLRGVISNNPKSWSLSYSSLKNGLSTTDWTELPIPNNALTENSDFGFPIGTNSIVDGEYMVRLLVENNMSQEGNSGQKVVDYGYFKLEKLKVLNPQNSDVIRLGDKIPISLTVEKTANVSQYVLEYSSSVTSSGQWITLVRSKKPDLVLDTSQLPKGDVNIRISIVHDGIQDSKEIAIHVDETLKKGWPQKISWEKDPWYGGYLWGGFVEPVVTDLDGDGKKEIITALGGDPPKLYAYKLDGTLLWKSNIGNSGGGGVPGGNLNIPIIDDINGDGKKEIFVFNYGPDNLPDFSSSSKIYAFDYQGNALLNWPVSLPNKEWKVTALAADLYQDGKKELVVQGDSGITIIDANGKIIKSWGLARTKWSSLIISTPAVGNFDSDNQLEIVVARLSKDAGGIYDGNTFVGWNNEGEIHVFKLNGTELPGWPIKTDGIIFSSPVVGDIDKDGKNDIVVGLEYATDNFPDNHYGGLYVFNADGKVLPGWPVRKGSNYSSSPSLADFDNDGYLEITASSLGFNTEVYKYNGALMPGWPQQTSWNDYYSTIVGDINGDKAPDILTTMGFNLYGWNVNGTAIPGFPKTTENDAQAFATIADLDGDGKLELIASSDWDFDQVNRIYKRRSSLYVWELPGSLDQSTMHWPTFHHDEQRTGRYQSIPVSQTLQLTMGYSLVGLTTDKGTNYKAEDFLKDLNAGFVGVNIPNKTQPQGNKILSITQFDRERGRYIIHNVGNTDNNFPIVVGEGYFIRTNWPGSTTISGTAPALSSMTIAKGHSIISFPTVPTNLTNAENVLQAMKSQGIDVRQITRWFGGRWLPHDITSQANGFSITPGEGYFIRNFGEAKTFIIP